MARSNRAQVSTNTGISVTNRELSFALEGSARKSSAALVRLFCLIWPLLAFVDFMTIPEGSGVFAVGRLIIAGIVFLLWHYSRQVQSWQNTPPFAIFIGSLLFTILVVHTAPAQALPWYFASLTIIWLMGAFLVQWNTKYNLCLWLIAVVSFAAPAYFSTMETAHVALESGGALFLLLAAFCVWIPGAMSKLHRNAVEAGIVLRKARLRGRHTGVAQSMAKDNALLTAEEFSAEKVAIFSSLENVDEIRGKIKHKTGQEKSTGLASATVSQLSAASDSKETQKDASSEKDSSVLSNLSDDILTNNKAAESQLSIFSQALEKEAPTITPVKPEKTMRSAADGQSPDSPAPGRFNHASKPVFNERSESEHASGDNINSETTGKQKVIKPWNPAAQEQKPTKTGIRFKSSAFNKLFETATTDNANPTQDVNVTLALHSVLTGLQSDPASKARSVELIQPEIEIIAGGNLPGLHQALTEIGKTLSQTAENQIMQSVLEVVDDKVHIHFTLSSEGLPTDDPEQLFGALDKLETLLKPVSTNIPSSMVAAGTLISRMGGEMQYRRGNGAVRYVRVELPFLKEVAA